MDTNHVMTASSLFSHIWVFYRQIEVVWGWWKSNSWSVTVVMQKYICKGSKQSPSIGTCCTRMHRCDAGGGVSARKHTRCGFVKLNSMQISSRTHLTGNNGACVHLQRKGGTRARCRTVSQSKAEHANERFTTAPSTNTPKTLNDFTLKKKYKTGCKLWIVRKWLKCSSMLMVHSNIYIAATKAG